MTPGGVGAEAGGGPSSLRAFAHSSSLHGISHVFAYGAASLRRALWGGFFLGSLGLLGLVCAERVAYFLSYPHVTKLDEVAAPNLTFPAITICNLNEFRFSKITRNDLFHVGELLALLNERQEISHPQLAEPRVLAALRDKANFRGFKAKPFSMAEFYNRTGHDLADMLLQCSFRGAGCSPRNFTVVSRSPRPPQGPPCPPWRVPPIGMANRPHQVLSCPMAHPTHWDPPRTPGASPAPHGTSPPLAWPTDPAMSSPAPHSASHPLAPPWDPWGLVCPPWHIPPTGILPGHLGPPLPPMARPTHCHGQQTSPCPLLPPMAHPTHWHPPQDPQGLICSPRHIPPIGMAKGPPQVLSCSPQHILPPDTPRASPAPHGTSHPSAWPRDDPMSSPTPHGTSHPLVPPRDPHLGYGMLWGTGCWWSRMLLGEGWSWIRGAHGHGHPPGPGVGWDGGPHGGRGVVGRGGHAPPAPPDFLVQRDSEFCACRTPCASVRYGKELSMVKIPSKASARYLARKFNKTEQYIA
ncbi:PREDICTED: proline-rich protein 36-like [Calidris pugnax]|uniref:proline-rich protein 36-like n=1 Tax=Calidris pugnax TaxID=198806 RepID=UPI00071CC3B0|nr:PREDICTED: proline-rich protein 36-like [Calidris pugnax]